MTKPRLIVVGPVPPPIHGVTVSTSLVLENPVLREHFDVEHFDTSDHRSGRNVGTWEWKNVWLGLFAVARLARSLRGDRGIVYLPLSQSPPGFLRDSLFIHAAHAFGWRVAGHLRGSDFRSFYTSSPSLWRRWMRLTLRRIDSVGVMGSSLCWVFHGLVPPDRITVVANGTPEPARAGVMRDPEHVLFLSNLRQRKGVVQAVDAALLVLARRPTARFTFAGEWESEELERELRARVAPSRASIVFSPPVQGAEKDKLLASSSVLLFPPAEPEGHPRVVLEALAAGVPVVTTDRGAIRETVVDGESGYVLADPVPGVLADRIDTILSDDELRGRLGRAARQRHLDLFTQGAADRALAAWLRGLV